MRAFEKWAAKQDKDPRPYGSEEWARECGWRAGLEWVLSLSIEQWDEEFLSIVNKEVNSSS